RHESDSMNLKRCAIKWVARKMSTGRILMSRPGAAEVAANITGLETEGRVVLLTSVARQGLDGLALEDDTFSVPVSIPWSSVKHMVLRIQHYFSGSSFDYEKPWRYLLDQMLFRARRQKLMGRTRQFVFNLSTMPRRERIEVLRHLVETAIQ